MPQHAHVLRACIESKISMNVETAALKKRLAANVRSHGGIRRSTESGEFGDRDGPYSFGRRNGVRLSIRSSFSMTLSTGHPPCLQWVLRP